MKKQSTPDKTQDNTEANPAQKAFRPKQAMTVPMDGLLALVLLSMVATVLLVLFVDNEVLDNLRGHLQIDFHLGRTNKIGSDLTLRFYDARGEAEPIRLMLREIGLPYRDQVSSPQKSQADEFTANIRNGAPFGELPLLTAVKDKEQIKISGSSAIMRYLARNAGLYGKNSAEATQCDIVANGAERLRALYDHFLSLPKEKQNKDNYIKTTAHMWILFFENWLINNGAYFGKGKFFVGDDITFVDFMVFDLLDVHLQMDATLLDKVPLIKSFYERIESRPVIEKYINSPERRKMVTNSPLKNFW